MFVGIRVAVACVGSVWCSGKEGCCCCCVLCSLSEADNDTFNAVLRNFANQWLTSLEMYILEIGQYGDIENPYSASVSNPLQGQCHPICSHEERAPVICLTLLVQQNIEISWCNHLQTCQHYDGTQRLYEQLTSSNVRTALLLILHLVFIYSLIYFNYCTKCRSLFYYFFIIVHQAVVFFIFFYYCTTSHSLLYLCIF